MLEIPRPKRVFDAKRTDPAVVNRIRELALTHADEQIAARLNQEEFTTGTGLPFTRLRVQRIRYDYEIPTGCPCRAAACPDGQRGDGRYSAHAAAELLNVGVSTIAAWCRSGRLDGIRATARGYWWIKLTPEIIAEPFLCCDIPPPRASFQFVPRLCPQFYIIAVPDDRCPPN